jgi:hypothetical protein
VSRGFSRCRRTTGIKSDARGVRTGTALCRVCTPNNRRVAGAVLLFRAGRPDPVSLPWPVAPRVNGGAVITARCAGAVPIPQLSRVVQRFVLCFAETLSVVRPGVYATRAPRWPARAITQLRHATICLPYLIDTGRPEHLTFLRPCPGPGGERLEGRTSSSPGAGTAPALPTTIRRGP